MNFKGAMVFRWLLTIRVQKSVISVSNFNSSVVADNPRVVSDNLVVSSPPFSLRRGGIWITPTYSKTRFLAVKLTFVLCNLPYRIFKVREVGWNETQAA